MTSQLAQPLVDFRKNLVKSKGHKNLNSTYLKFIFPNFPKHPEHIGRTWGSSLGPSNCGSSLKIISPPVILRVATTNLKEKVKVKFSK